MGFQLNRYEIRFNACDGTGFHTEIFSSQTSDLAYNSFKRKYPSADMLWLKRQETPKPYSLDDPLADNARPLRRDFD